MDNFQVRISNIDEAMNFAIESVKTDQLPQAFDICRQVLEMQPDNIQALLLMKHIFEKTGHPGHTVRRIEKALFQHKHAQDPQWESIDLLRKEGRYREAADICRDIIAGYPNDGEAYEKLGFICLESGMFPDSLEAYLNALAIDDSNTDIFSKIDCLMNKLVIEHPGDLHDYSSPPFSHVFKTRERTYHIRSVFNYDEQLHHKDTLYLTERQGSPPVFSIVSPWGPLACRRRSYPFLYHSKNCFIEKVHHRLVAHDKNCQPIPSSYLPVIPLTHQNPFVSRDHTYGLYGIPKHAYTVEEPCIVIDSCLRNFAHFMHDYLPYMLFAVSHPQAKDFKIIVPEITANEERILEYVNFPRQKIIEWKELTARLGEDIALKFTDAYFTIHMPLPVVIEEIRRAFHCESTKRSRGRGRKIYISRKPSEKISGRISNEKELIATLDKKGFEIVVPETLSIEEQVRLFSDASVIVGAAGAGIFSQIWAPRGASLIILMSEENYKYAIKETEGYEEVSRCLGHSYYRLIYRSLYETEEMKRGSCEVAYEVDGIREIIHIADVPYRCDPEEVAMLAEFAFKQQSRVSSPDN